MTYLNFLIPPFLNRIDDYLKLQAPHIWRTRIHFVLFYGLIAWGVLFSIGLFYPLSMYDISRTPYAVEEIKRVSFLFLLVCGFFSIVYWWQQVAKFRILAARWYHAFWECILFFIGILVLWQSVNAFQYGLNTNIAYRVGNKITLEDRERLYAHNFYLPGYIAFNTNDLTRLSPDDTTAIDSFFPLFFLEAEKLMQVYHNRIMRNDVVQDSQFLVRSGFLSDKLQEYDNDKYRYYYHSGCYGEWQDSINRKAQKYVKPHLALVEKWDAKNDEFINKWEFTPFSSYDYFTLDSVYQLFTNYDKYQVDSVKNVSINTLVDRFRKEHNLDMPNILSSIRRRDIVAVLDTCSNVFFNHQGLTYLDLLKSENKNFEKVFWQNQIVNHFTQKDLEAYRKYLTEIMLSMPVSNRNDIQKMEVGLYFRRDSLTTNFLSQLTQKDRRIYEGRMAFAINNLYKKEDAATIVGNLKWNKQTGKYSEIEKYLTKGFFDKVVYYADSIYFAKYKRSFSFDKLYNVIDNNIGFVYNALEDWQTNKDTFYIVTGKCKYVKRDYVCTTLKKMRRDSIPIDTVFRWEIEKIAQYNDLSIKNELFDTEFNNYKKYRDTQISEQDSIFLDRIYTRCGYLRDSSEHSRLFFHVNAYYLYLADITINKSRAFLSGWNPLYLSTNNKLAIMALSLLMFFTTLAHSNLFTAIFIAFFINFVNNTLFNFGQNFQEIDKSKQSLWLFGLLAILALITAWNVLFRTFKLPIVYQLINIQLFIWFGIFIWLFDSQTIEQQSNYGYFVLIFWCLMVWRFRYYLSLPSKT
ncbi:MAG: hypothetical protein JNL70_04675 [Saprospiraceae bacterium]|nr:hypothetical protein [Saprospiraceae bacterium]